MNNYSDRYTPTESSKAGADKPVAIDTYPRIFLPKKIYDALPAAYISAGTLFVLGSVYIGINHVLAVGYLAVGLSCILAGVTVNGIRRGAGSI